jgi:hypothetical protein
MSQLVANCPRCRSQKITFDVLHQNHVNTKHGWQYWFEAFCVCRHCGRSTVFILSQKSEPTLDYLHETPLSSVPGSVNQYAEVEGFVSHKDTAASPPPEHLPPDIDAAFREGATCMATGCFNAGATMFRLCIDHATRAFLPADNVDGLTQNIRRSLGLRLGWLFDHHKLPDGLKELSQCIKEDGNDGAHAGTLKEEDAEDIEDFTFELLERLYTEPQRLALAKQRRDDRRKTS